MYITQCTTGVSVHIIFELQHMDNLLHFRKFIVLLWILVPILDFVDNVSSVLLPIYIFLHIV